MTRHKPLPRNWLDAATTFLEIADFTTDRPQLDSPYNRAAKPTKTAVIAPRRDKRDIVQSSLGDAAQQCVPPSGAEDSDAKGRAAHLGSVGRTPSTQFKSSGDERKAVAPGRKTVAATASSRDGRGL